MPTNWNLKRRLHIMRTRKGMKPEPQDETLLAEVEAGGATNANAPQKMTLAENVILTLKLLAGLGLIGLALWGIILWKAAR